MRFVNINATPIANCAPAWLGARDSALHEFASAAANRGDGLSVTRAPPSASNAACGRRTDMGHVWTAVTSRLEITAFTASYDATYSHRACLATSVFRNYRLTLLGWLCFGIG